MTDIALERGAARQPLRIAAERRRVARAAGVPVLDIVVPGVQRAGRARRLGAPAAPPPSGELPLPGADHHRRQRQRRRHTPDRRRTRRRADRRSGGAAGAEGSRACAACGVVDLGRAGAGVHGRRPVHRPRRARPAGGAADLRPFGPGDRHQARPGLARRARPQARDHLPLLQPDPEIDAVAPASPTHNAASRRSGPTSPSACCPTSPTPDGSSTPNCWCWPSAAACASTRSRWTGWTTRTAGSTSSPPPTADLKGIGRLLRGFADGSIPVNAIAAQLGSSRLSAAPGSLFRQVVRFGADRRRVDRRLRWCCSC